MPDKIARDAESQRLLEDTRRERYWKRWGPYLSERQWGTVREDYGSDGNSWGYFPFEQSGARAYRWGEDGLLGITDRQCRLCFALALWNGKDPILKERLFGLTNPEGNHGEDVKEYYFYLDATPTSSYLKALYKYPQCEFPYARLREESRRRGRGDREFELLDAGVFEHGRYFDVFVEYAKAEPEDVLIRVTVANRGPVSAKLWVLPTLWYRNTWTWNCTHEGCEPKPRIRQPLPGRIVADHISLGRMSLAAEGDPGFLFTENETDAARIFNSPNASPYVKDAFEAYLLRGQKNAVHPAKVGTKAAAVYPLEIPAGGQVVLRLRLRRDELPADPFDGQFDDVFAKRIVEADEFYRRRTPELPDEQRRINRQAYAGLLWSKQFYHYAVKEWLEGDPDSPPRAPAFRNRDWAHLFNRDVVSMPDKWEYPWYATWDLAFHMIPFARIDPRFAKDQLLLFLREWYMHPNGQLPAYEWDFNDVNPPVHAWACYRIYKLTGRKGRRDVDFLERCFQKLLLNFTWWVNRKDVSGRHLFAGGFLGLDNIGVFDRSKPLPDGFQLEQADGTAWMAFYCTSMLAIALELAQTRPVYEDVASKFFEHFIAIADAMNTMGGSGLWDEQDGFYYDQLRSRDAPAVKVRTASMVGLAPLFAVLVLEDAELERLPGFRKRMQWLLEHRRDLAQHVAYMQSRGQGARRLLAIPSRERLLRVLSRLLDESEFLSEYGIRSFSRRHKDAPYVFGIGGGQQSVRYVSGESESGLFGGNSNWRGPIWFPMNYLLVDSLERYHYYYGDSLKVECPTGSGRMMNLKQVAHELAQRLVKIFLPDQAGRRPLHGDDTIFASDPNWRNNLLFYEYFDGDSGRGLGASHQTGWTALVARLVEDCANRTTGAAAAPAK